MSSPQVGSHSGAGFIAAVAQANDKYICTAKADDVGKVNIRHLLSRQLKVPIFQRRYCWSKDQWNTLFDDVEAMINNGKEKHSLGRITCAVSAEDSSRILVIDGQQRNTTATLMLAAIRDTASARKESRELAESLNSILIPDIDAFHAWLRKKRIHKPNQAITVTEGECLNFVALLPTYCDRAPFFSAVLPLEAGVSAERCRWQRPLQAKAHFKEKFAQMSSEQLQCFAEAVLSKLEWLYFPIDLTSNYQDGTDNLQVIFERLAIRDAAFCRPSRSSEFVGLGAADFVRNLLLGSFPDEQESIKMYEDQWLPIESAAEATSERTGLSAGTLLEMMLENFLKAHPRRAEGGACKPPSINAALVGGPIYPRFRRWFTAALEEGEDQTADWQGRTIEILAQLKQYAMEQFARGNEGALRHGRPTANPSGKEPRRQTCKYCRTSSPGTAAKCHGCGMPLLPPVLPSLGVACE
mmetsp:Transcript_33090/g.77422  ORF Transcript_33090/g.77422 Transcript_33090/m.77422 type:complete len:468 (+) Transcript_33090:67-1470(+)